MKAFAQGKKEAEGDLFVAVREGLCARARKILRFFPNADVDEDDLVSELWGELTDVLLSVNPQNRAHFFGIANKRMWWFLYKHVGKVRKLPVRNELGTGTTKMELLDRQPWDKSSARSIASNWVNRQQAITELHLLIRAYDQLNDEDLQLLGLIYFQSMTPGKVAKILRCHRNTVTNRHKKIIEALKKEMPKS